MVPGHRKTFLYNTLLAQVRSQSQLTINMRLQTLLSQDALEVSKFSNFLLIVGETTEPEDDNQMIHIYNIHYRLGYFSLW